MCPVCTNVWVRDLDNYRYPVEKIGKCPTQYGKEDPRYLHKYERIHFHGEEGDEEVSNDSRSSRKSQVSLTSMVPMVYHHNQHEVSDQMRSITGMSQEKYVPSGFEKLCLSLISGLPNEVDYALNIITILSKNEQNILQLSKVPKLVDLLLAHTGIYSKADRGLQVIIEDGWKGLPGGKLSQFWLDTIDLSNSDLKTILIENVCKEKDIEQMEEDEDLFCIHRNLGCHDREGQRILRIAHILRNLSFEAANMQVLAQNLNFLRFLVLCSNCLLSELKGLSFDVLGNVAGKIALKKIDSVTKTLVLRTVVDGMTCQDRFFVIRGLEIISKLCQIEGNNRTISRSLSGEVYQTLCNYMLVQDVCLLIYTLEAVYQLTGLGDEPCTGIANIHRSFEILMNLLTVDPQSYGKEALQGMKLVTVHDTNDIPTVKQQPPPAPSTPPPVQSSPQRAQPPTVLSNASPKQYTTIAPSINQLLPVYIIGPPPATPSVPMPNVMEQDPETYARTWLKTYFDLDYTSSISKQELYNDFVSYTVRSGHKSVIPNQVNFANCVRTVFPHSTEKKKSGANGEVSLHHDGICRKSVPSLPHHPLTVTVSPSLTQTPVVAHSPILKAHLSAPPKCPASPNSVKSQNAPQVVSRMPNQPNQTTPKSKDTNNTILIKSLLANKVNRNLHQKQLQQHDVESASTLNSTSNPDQNFTTTPVLNSNPKKKTLESVKQGKDITPNKSKAAVLLAAKLNGIQKSISEAISANEVNHETNADAPSGVNGIASKVNVKEQDGCEKLFKAVTSNLPVIQNADLDPSRREKIYKSSPLLNGLLDAKVDLLTEIKPRLSIDVKEPVKTVTTNHMQNGNAVIKSANFVSPIETKTIPNNEKDSSNLSSEKSIPKPSTEVKTKTIPNVPVVIQEQNSDSNLSSSDLSSLSDIAKTVESASVVLNQNSVAPEVISTVPKKDKIIEAPSLVLQNPCQTFTFANTSIPITQTSGIHTLQFVPVLTNSKIQLIGQTNLSVCLNLIPSDQINISNSKPLPSLKRPFVPSTEIVDPKKSRVDCSNIIKLESTGDENGVIIMQNGVLQSKDEVTLKTGHQTTIADLNLIDEKKTPTVNSVKIPLKPVIKAEDNKKNNDRKKIPTAENKLEYYCEWQGCGRTFENPLSVYLHACEIHAPVVSSSINIPCMWDKCDRQPRKRLSLMTHLQDRHCSENILKMIALRKQQISKIGKTNLPAPQNIPAHPGYPPNAAFQAIKRHALQFVCASDVVSEKKEDVLAKSTRLSAALIIRNIVKYSSIGKRKMKQHESKISLIALSNVESSPILAQCLAALISDSSSESR
ncbi:AT-rich interactive domain-containing protein 2 [Nymphon striatum]|nr:AT-rich interactive domain-containing protein 2 [Nymphon striatum]